MNSEQKILHVVEAFGGGVVTYLNSLTRGQCEMGYDVYVAYGRRDETPANFEDLFDSRIHWIEIRDFKRPIGFHDIKVMRTLMRIFKEINPDIIHSHSSKAGVICRLLFKFSSVRQFYTPHGFAFLMSNISKKKRAFYLRVEKLCARFSRCTTIACSKGEYGEAVHLGGKSAYVENGVSPDELNPFEQYCHLERDHYVVCIVGRVVSQKNPVFFNEIAKKLPYVHFVWIGDGLLRSKLTSPNIEVTGWVTREEALARLASSDMFILTSLWEGLSMSLLEAMYLKRVCVVTDIIGSRDVIKDGVNGFIGKTPDDFARIIHDAITGKIDVDTIANNARNDVLQKYNANDFATKYDKLYRKTEI